MSELTDITTDKVFIKFKGEEKEIRFGFKAWGELIKRYNGLQNIDRMQEELEDNPFIAIPEILWIGLVDKENVDKEEFMDLPDYPFSEENMNILGEIITKSIMKALPTNDKKKSKTMKK